MKKSHLFPIIAVAILFCSCTRHTESQKNLPPVSSYKQTPTASTAETPPTSTAETSPINTDDILPPPDTDTAPPEDDFASLSESCDMILAGGVDDGGVYYELVANQTEDYRGTVVEIGVIKNNTWLLEPTSQMPFVDEDGTLYGTEVKSIYALEDINILYIGNGCFLCEAYYENGAEMENMIYNVETKQSYEKILDRYKRVCLTYDCLTGFYGSNPDYDRRYYLSADDSTLIIDFLSYGSSGRAELLDTNTMEVFSIDIEYPHAFGSMGQVYPVSEDIFAIANNYSNHNKIAFYNTDGTLLFENDFSLRTQYQCIWFRAGMCSIQILNDADTAYRIDIDKEGNVVNSYKLS